MTARRTIRRQGRIASGRMGRKRSASPGGAVAEVLAAPEFEGEERPQGAAMVATAAHVLADETVDGAGIEETAGPDGRGSEHVVHEGGERTPKPFPERHAEALLAPAPDRRRQLLRQRLLEQRLEPAK